MSSPHRTPSPLSFSCTSSIHIRRPRQSLTSCILTRPSLLLSNQNGRQRRRPNFSISMTASSTSRNGKSQRKPENGNKDRSDRDASNPCSHANSDVLLANDLKLLSSLSNKTVIVTGGTGLVGSVLVNQLVNLNAKVILFARNRSRAFHPSSSVSFVQYDASDPKPITGQALEALKSSDVIFNLAGEPIDDGRWTESRKQILRDSRVVGTNKLILTLKSFQKQDQIENKTFISVSAVGRYGTSETNTYTEDNVLPNPKDFLSQLANEWEQVVFSSSPNGSSSIDIRKVVIRSGVVLSPDGGIMESILPLFRAFLGGPPGSGRQWLSWIHIYDIVRLLLYSSTDKKYQGIYNGTAPKPVRLKEFCKVLGSIIERPSWLPVPKMAVNLLLGTEAAQLVLAGQCVIPKKTKDVGFIYRYNDVESALQHLLLNNSNNNSSSSSTSKLIKKKEITKS